MAGGWPSCSHLAVMIADMIAVAQSVLGQACCTHTDSHTGVILEECAGVSL